MERRTSRAICGPCLNRTLTSILECPFFSDDVLGLLSGFLGDVGYGGPCANRCVGGQIRSRVGA
eukprot:6983885-Lingulodinium_polyedra.AAC.1